MSFRTYVDKLAKDGMIDGNIAERLVALHCEETGNPYVVARRAIDVTLKEMWQWPLDGSVNAQAVHTFADAIDDTLDDF